MIFIDFHLWPLELTSFSCPESFSYAVFFPGKVQSSSRVSTLRSKKSEIHIPARRTFLTKSNQILARNVSEKISHFIENGSGNKILELRTSKGVYEKTFRKTKFSGKPLYTRNLDF